MQDACSLILGDAVYVIALNRPASNIYLTQITLQEEVNLGRFRIRGDTFVFPDMIEWRGTIISVSTPDLHYDLQADSISISTNDDSLRIVSSLVEKRIHDLKHELETIRRIVRPDYVFVLNMARSPSSPLGIQFERRVLEHLKTGNILRNMARYGEKLPYEYIYTDLAKFVGIDYVDPHIDEEDVEVIRQASSFKELFNDAYYGGAPWVFTPEGFYRLLVDIGEYVPQYYSADSIPTHLMYSPGVGIAISTTIGNAAEYMGNLVGKYLYSESKSSRLYVGYDP